MAAGAGLIGLVGGTIVIASAWGFQLIGGYVPCKLCLEQRIPYYVGLPMILLALVLAMKGKRAFATLMFAAAGLAFLYGAGLGAYQAGAEWDFWAGPSDCGGGSAAPGSAANMLSALKSTRVVSCTEASWRLFGLSFAGWNAVASAGIAFMAFAGAFFAKRSPRES